MHLKNEAARLITVNFGGEKFKILPGENPAVEVPDEAAKLPFVKALLKSGDLRRVGSDELGEQEEDGDDGLDELTAQAKALGIKVDKRWKAERLAEEIAKAQKAE